MAIVNKKKGITRRIISQANLQLLLLPSEFHPNGRVQLDPKTRMPERPDRNILYTTEIEKKGKVIEVEVNGGHALEKGSVWRVALKGPTRFIWKMLRDELHYRIDGPDRKGRKSVTAPRLLTAEMSEARMYVAWLLLEAEKGTTILPDDFLSQKYDNGMRETFAKLDAKFYKWLEQQETPPELAKLTDVYHFLPA